jgi:nicotinate-nucleotide adenylyltransferase
MVQLAIDGDDRFIASRVDIDRPGPTYAVDTLSDLQREFATVHPAIDANWSFIVGADALADFMDWHAPGRILELADLVGVTRPGHALAAPPIPADRLTLLEVASLDISSSTIRHLVATGATIEELVAPSVAQYIAEHRLYQQVEGQDRDGSR